MAEQVFVFPASFAQQRLWFLDQIAPGTALYNIPAAWRLRGPLDTAALERSFAEIARRHESLRTTIASRDGHVVQVVTPHCDRPLTVVDLTALEPDRREVTARAVAAAQAGRSFDLAEGPLFRVVLIRLSDREHDLVLTLHHIVADAWSLDVLVRELRLLYEAFRTGQPSPLEVLPIQYADFTLWQHERLHGQVLEEELAYWKAQLQGCPRLQLATDKPRKAGEVTAGYRCRTLPRSLAAALTQLARREGVTPFMLMTAAFQALLSRYSGQDDISVGTPVAARNQPGTESLVGLFANTVVLRASLAGNPSFKEMLARVRNVALDAYAHQDIPFQHVVEALQPHRDVHETPLFQAMIALQTASGDAASLADLVVTPLAIESGAAKFDLTMWIRDDASTLTASIEYRQDLFEGETIGRMLEHFERLLAGAAADPDRPLANIVLSPPDERRWLATWNDTGADYPHERCLHELFEAQVERTPDAIAAVDGSTTLTYRELNARANRLAAYLATRGVTIETAVAVALHRRVELVVALLGVLKAGGAYVPLDPNYPIERVAYVLRDAKARLLTERRLLDAWRLDGDGSLCLDEEWEAMSSESDAGLATGTHPDNLAYIMYTSGSTGRPKGTMVSHRGLANYLSWAIAAYDVAGGGGAPVHSSIGFDLTVTSLFCPLLAGEPVVLLPDDDSVEELAGTLSGGANFSLLKITPAHLQMLRDLLPGGPAKEMVRSVVIGGETLMGEDLTWWQDRSPATIAFNEYGPTETVVGCCVEAVPGTSRRSGPISIGRPIANTDIHVLDRSFRLVPRGVPGELAIGGPGVARGYLNRPDLTAEKFIPHPCSDTPGARLYRSGDLARHAPDGNMQFLGRIDEQVKIRGFRIEPGEIEAVLKEHPQVRDAVVTAREDRNGTRYLVAYVVAEPGVIVEPDDLRAVLRRTLPDYMVPAHVLVLDALPLTANGKIDRAMLPVPASGETARAKEPPRTRAERAVAAVWQEVLGRPDIGAHDDFFDLGGHSLLAARVVSRLRAQFRTEVPLRAVFDAPTVAELAATLTRSQVGEEDELTKALEEILTLSDADAERLLAGASSETRTATADSRRGGA